MTTYGLSTPPTRLAQGKDAWRVREKTVDAIGNLNTAVNGLVALTGATSSNTNAIAGGLSFGNISAGRASANLHTQMFTGTSPSVAGAAFTLSHDLGQIPNGAILIQSNVAAILYGTASSQAWTNTEITLMLNAASVNYCIMVLG